MIIKIAIIGVILVAGGLIFSSDINGLFPNTTDSFSESLTNDVSKMGTNTADSIKERIDTSVNKVEKQLDDSLSKATESSKDFISETVETNPLDQIGSIFRDGISGFSSGGSSSNKPISNNDESTTKQSTEQLSISTSTNDQNLVYETLSLSTTQQNDENILLQYQDTSGKTESVDVTIKNSEKELFSGKFFSSMFETTVNDASDMPYQIEMVVIHQEYGTVVSSVFNPGDSSDSTINGIFTQS